MRVVICCLLLCLYGVEAQTAAIFERVDSVIEETISEGVQVQLIDADYHDLAFLSIRTRSVSNKADLIKHKEYYQKHGFPYTYSSFKDYSTIIVKLPVEQYEEVLQSSIANLENQDFRSLSFTVMGQINQQRVLGLINRFYSNTTVNILASQSESAVSVDILKYDFPFEFAQPKSSTKATKNIATSLVTGFLLCQIDANNVPLFYLDQDGFRCIKPADTRQLHIDEKLVANYKSDLMQRSRFINSEPFEWLQLLSQFSKDRGYEQFLSYYKGLQTVSIDDVIALYNERLLEVTDSHPATESVESKQKYDFNQNVEDRFEVDIFEIEEMDGVFRFTFAVRVDNSFCVLIDCKNSPYYLTVADNHLNQTLSFSFSPEISQQVLGYINEHLVPFILGQEGLRQKDLVVALSGDFTVEQLDGLFFALGKLPSSSSLMIQQKGILDTSDSNSRSWKLPVLPGDQDWPVSELLYYVLKSSLSEEAEVVKDNSIIGLKPQPFFNVNRFSSTLTVRPANKIHENLNTSLLVDEKQFEQWKKSLLNNLRLQDSKYQTKLLTKVFGLKDYNEQLNKGIAELTLSDFKQFVQSSLIEHIE